MGLEYGMEVEEPTDYTDQFTDFSWLSIRETLDGLDDTFAEDRKEWLARLIKRGLVSVIIAAGLLMMPYLPHTTQ